MLDVYDVTFDDQIDPVVIDFPDSALPPSKNEAAETASALASALQTIVTGVADHYRAKKVEEMKSKAIKQVEDDFKDYGKGGVLIQVIMWKSIADDGWFPDATWNTSPPAPDPVTALMWLRGQDTIEATHGNGWVRVCDYFWASNKALPKRWYHVGDNSCYVSREFYEKYYLPRGS